MKKIRSFLAIILSIVMLFGMNTAAFAAEAEFVPTGLCLADADDAVTTVIDYTGGSSFVAEGIIDLTETEHNPIIESIEEYEVCYQNKTILTVEPRDITAAGSSAALCNGYYAITFAIPNTARECFLTGLLPEKVELIQEKLLAAYTEDEGFLIEDVDIIDADKTMDDDHLQCWAASTSNMLHYSGWGQKAGFETEDDLFDLFNEHFIDDGYRQDSALNWFFGGYIGEGGNRDLFITYPDSGGYLKEYDVREYVNNYSLEYNGTENLSEMYRHLRNGEAIGMNTIGHAMILWGYIVDNEYPEDDMAHYPQIIYCDNQDGYLSCYGYPQDRRVIPNQLLINPLSVFTDEDGLYGSEIKTYYSLNYAMLREYITLAPYSDDYQIETDPKATLDRIHDPDLTINGASLCNSDSSNFMTDIVHDGSDIYMHVDLYNCSDAGFICNDSGAAIDLKLYRDNEFLYSVSEPIKENISSNSNNRFCFNIGNLDAGEYTAELTVSAGSVPEAYLMNNSYACDFTVCDSEFDAQPMSLSADCDNKLYETKANIRISYDDISPDLIHSADRLRLTFSGRQSNGKWSVYSRPIYSVAAYDDEYPILPAEITVDTIYTAFRLRLYLAIGDLVYIVDSPEYDLNAVHLSLTKSDFTLTPVPNGSTKLNEEEEIAFRLTNTTVGYDDPLPVRYSLYYFTGDDHTQLTEPREITLAHGEISEEITASSFEIPLERHGLIYVLCECEADGGTYSNYLYLTDISVIEKGSNTVDCEEWKIDPCDGHTSLPEALSYCEDEGVRDVLFAPDCRRVFLDEMIEIDSDIRFFNNDAEHPVTMICRFHDKDAIVVGENGSLELDGIIFTAKQSGHGGIESESVIKTNGGSLIVSDCFFNNIPLSIGCKAIDISSGTAVLKNSTFLYVGSSEGYTVYIDNGAQVEMLNCLFSFSGAEAEVYNKNGRLCIVNSLFNAITYSTCVKSEDQTYIVNSIINAPGNAVDANVSLYGTAYLSVGDGAVKDDNCLCFEPSEFFRMSGWRLNIMTDDHHLYPTLILRSGILNGYYVSENDGVLQLSKDGENWSSVGVRTSFTNEELSHDMTGLERLSVFGPYSKMIRNYYLGDADNNDSVEIIDATVIQRYDAQFKVPYGIETLMQGDVDGDGELSIIDVTLIQRYLASFIVEYRVGELIIDDAA